jgi:predicted kinase
VTFEALLRCRLAADAGARGRQSARAFWTLALADASSVDGPRLALCAGLTGSGKSFVANGIACALGARVIVADVVRKRLAGIAPTERTPVERIPEVYVADLTQRVYLSLAEQARIELEAGWPVVLDATYLTRDLRSTALGVARGLRAPAVVVWSELDDAAAAERLRARAAEDWTVSDGDDRIRARQRATLEQPRRSDEGAPVLRVDSSVSPAALFTRLLPRLRRALAQPGA